MQLRSAGISRSIETTFDAGSAGPGRGRRGSNRMPQSQRTTTPRPRVPADVGRLAALGELTIELSRPTGWDWDDRPPVWW
jgi:hypothetical protein